MKSRVFATISSLTLLTAAAAYAQSRVTEYDIPFAFHVGPTVLPAGHYEVRPDASHGVLSIRCFECKAGAMVITQATLRAETPDKGVLLFQRYGDKYFLSTVWTPGYSQGRVLLKSKVERELARNASQAAPVAVALNRR